MYASTEQRSRERVQVLAEQLYRSHYPRLLRIATRNAADRADAEEAVGFAFLAFIEKYDPDCGSPPLAWLTLVANRRAWALYRLQHLDRRVGQEAAAGSEQPGFSVAAIPSGMAGPEEAVERAENVAEARRRLAQLKPAERRTLGLIAAGYSYREVGEITQFSYTKVNRNASEGRAALREQAGA